jgi:phosphoribosylpyrophosphate synthetase
MINRPYIYGVRDQDTDEVEIACKEGVVSGKNVLIVNDIIHSGEVFSDEARQLRMLGARKIYVFATHCENGAYVNPDLIDRIYTTDSIAHDATGDFIDHTHWEIINVEI